MSFLKERKRTLCSCLLLLLFIQSTTISFVFYPLTAIIVSSLNQSNKEKILENIQVQKIHYVSTAIQVSVLIHYQGHPESTSMLTVNTYCCNFYVSVQVFFQVICYSEWYDYARTKELRVHHKIFSVNKICFSNLEHILLSQYFACYCYPKIFFLNKSVVVSKKVEAWIKKDLENNGCSTARIVKVVCFVVVFLSIFPYLFLGNRRYNVGHKLFVFRT